MQQMKYIIYFISNIMTRGNIIAIINDRKIVSTEQFNGDMYIKE